MADPRRSSSRSSGAGGNGSGSPAHSRSPSPVALRRHSVAAVQAAAAAAASDRSDAAMPVVLQQQAVQHTPAQQPRYSFAQQLLFDFEEAVRIGDDGIKSTKDIMGFFKRRVQLETEYARGLEKLAQQYRTLMPAQRRQNLLSDQSQWGEALPLSTAWHNCVEEAAFTAVTHDQLAAQLSSLVVEPVNTSIKELETIRKTLVSEGHRHQKRLHEAYTVLKKAQAQQAAIHKEATDLLDQTVKAKHNFLTKDSTISKLEGKSSVAEEKAAAATQTLAQLEAQCTQLQEDHYQHLLPEVLLQLEAREMERCIKLKQGLLRSARLARDATERIFTVQERLSQLVESADTRRDIDDMLALHEANSQDLDLPVTSILNPTLKGHLMAKSIDSNKPFKDYVFVLLKHKRLLYQYDSDNAQRPKQVIFLKPGNLTVRPVHTSLFHQPFVLQVTSAPRPLCLCAEDVTNYRQWFDTLKATCEPESLPRTLTAGFSIVRSLTVKVIEAKSLPRSADYYVVIKLDNETQASTQTQSSTSTPYWNETFEFDEIPVQTENVVLQLMRTTGTFTQVARQQAAMLKRAMAQFRDSPRRARPSSDSGPEKATTSKDRLSDVLVSRTTVRLSELGPTGRKEQWLPLMMALQSGDAAASSEDHGSIRLEVAVTEECVRSEGSYNALRSICSINNPGFKPLISTLNSKLAAADRLPLARALLAVAYSQNSLLDMLSALCEAEAEITTDPNTLFRGNSLASKAMDEFMKVVTIEQGSFLESALGMPVQAIYDLKASCELDPTRLADSRELASNLKRLLQYTTLVWNSLQHAIERAPPALFHVFAHLRQAVQSQFPTDAAAPRSAVVGFFFLRLICPAVLNPQLFGLQSHAADELTARTLTLVSKTLQNLANDVEFGQKEQFLIPMNEFIVSQKAAMQEFLDRLCQPPMETPTLSLNLVPSPRCWAALNRLLLANADSLLAGESPPSDLIVDLVHVIAQLPRPDPEDIDTLIKTEIEHQNQLAKEFAEEVAAKLGVPANAAASNPVLDSSVTSAPVFSNANNSSTPAADVAPRPKKTALGSLLRRRHRGSADANIPGSVLSRALAAESGNAPGSPTLRRARGSSPMAVSSRAQHDKPRAVSMYAPNLRLSQRLSRSQELLNRTEDEPVVDQSVSVALSNPGYSRSELHLYQEEETSTLTLQNTSPEAEDQETDL